MTTCKIETPERASDRRLARPRLRHLAAVGVLLAAVALAAAGCGGGGSTSASGATSQGAGSSSGSGTSGGSGGAANADSSQQSGVAYAQCMRAHGVSNFPDDAISSVGGGGVKMNLPSGIQSNPDYPSASQACQSKLPRGGASGGGGGSSANVQAEIKWANCMHAHGVTNAPEPNSSGRVIMKGGSGGVDPNSPTFQSAMQACRSDLPKGLQGGSAAAG